MNSPRLTGTMLVSIAFLMMPFVLLQGQVSTLEAVHIVEIFTGGEVDQVQKNEDSKGSFYVLEGHTGQVSFLARVHAVHGRLLSVEHLTASGVKKTYTWPGIRVVAHRGGARLGPPENTLQAIEKAIEVGADLIEVDIRQTRDGHLVLMHDVTVDRTTHGKGRLADMDLEEVRTLEVRHEGTDIIRVPTLREALMLMKGRIDPDLDYKEGDLDRLLGLVRELGMVESSTMYGSWERCRLIALKEPGMRIRPTAEYPLQVPSLARELRPAIINMDWHAVSEEAIRLAHTHGCLAFVNCLGRADKQFYMRLAVAAGADYIQSDRPDLVVAYLKNENLYRLSKNTTGLPATPLRSPQLAYPFR